MRARITGDLVLEVVSRFGQLRDVLLSIVAVAGWYRIADAADGTWLYAPAPDAPGLPLDEGEMIDLADDAADALPVTIHVRGLRAAEEA